jgi:hypothetical protein
MSLIINYIITDYLREIISEQASPAPTALETDNTKTDAGDSPFTPAEKKFLGKFDAYGSRHLGIIYSISDIGIREFITRSGKDFNLTPEILLKLIRDKIILIVPYTGWGRDDQYTLELQLPLEDIEGYGDEDKEKVEKGSEASGAPSDMGAGAPAEPPAPPAEAGLETAWVVKYGDILRESANSAKIILSEKTININTANSRMLKRLPKEFIKQLDLIVTKLSKKRFSKSEKERIIADILDNLALNLNLDDKHIKRSYDMFKKQAKLKKMLRDK